MNISKLLLFYIVSTLISVLLYSCSDNNEPGTLPAIDSDGYCLMYYCSEGNPVHDLSFMSAIESAASFSNPKINLTCLFKYSGEEEGSAHSVDSE